MRSICLVLISSVLTVPHARGQDGPWRKVTQVPTLRGASSACVIGDKMYVIGGVTTVFYVDLAANEVYDPSLNSWETKAPMQYARGYLSTAVVDGIIYAMGGGAPTDKVEAYDPVVNTWTTMQDMLSPRRGAQAGVVDGIIYNIGGNQSERNCEAYDPFTNTWTRKQDRPESGGDVAVTVYNGLVYTFGGGYFDNVRKNVYAYDPKTDTWSKKSDMPTARLQFQTYLVGGKIYAIGGSQTRYGALKTVEAYDPVSDTWETLEDMPEALAWFAGVVVNNRIYVISGSPDGGVSGTGDVWEYTPPDSPAVGVEVSYELPKHFVLEQNYPNPFNPTTVVRYQLPAAGDVRLAVYDLLGREVSVLVSERREAGVHEVKFDGSGLSSGVYLYRLRAGEFVQTRKLLLVR